MSLDQKITDFLATAEAGTGRSKLDPYAELIRTLRQRRWTYRRIAGALAAEFGVVVAPSTLFAFVKVRARKREAVALPEPTAMPAAPASSTPRKPRFKVDV